MAKAVIPVLIALSVFTGCATNPSGLETPQPSIVIDDTVVDKYALLADQVFDRAFSPLAQGSIEYLVDGEDYFPRLVHAIQSAKESIDIRV